MITVAVLKRQVASVCWSHINNVFKRANPWKAIPNNSKSIYRNDNKLFIISLWSPTLSTFILPSRFNNNVVIILTLNMLSVPVRACLHITPEGCLGVGRYTLNATRTWTMFKSYRRYYMWIALKHNEPSCVQANATFERWALQKEMLLLLDSMVDKVFFGGQVADVVEVGRGGGGRWWCVFVVDKWWGR